MDWFDTIIRLGQAFIGWDIYGIPVGLIITAVALGWFAFFSKTSKPSEFVGKDGHIETDDFGGDD